MATAVAGGGRATRRIVVAGTAILVLAAMALDTKIVRIGSPEDAPEGAFDAAAFGRSEFPKVQAVIEARAVDAAVLADAMAKDAESAEKQYGLATETGPEMAVKFTGVAGKDDFGVYDVAVPGVPGTVHVSVQTGPAINGTSLRDGSGLIRFGQFRNQIDYQNAGAALNTELKQQVLSKVDAAHLAGKTISVIGVFDLSDPADWAVTPVRLDVK